MRRIKIKKGFEKEEKPVNVNILFFTISIKKRDVSLEEAIHREVVEKRMQENRERYIQLIGRY
jgi:uncharacterized protein (TIGR02413 family)